MSTRHVKKSPNSLQLRRPLSSDSGRRYCAFMDMPPTEYRSNGRTYDMRQDTDTLWWIVYEREAVGQLDHNEHGWLAKVIGAEDGDEERTPDWQSTLDSYLDYLR